ncbi:MAG: glutamyl-tRNA reductase [Clostridia bacterium]|jgi:glutamyl-tRNA reductase|nr:glutamyl-tRNA reductase [Clostridia bacterium]
MNILSISYKTAPIEIRKKVSFSDEERPEFLKAAVKTKGVTQCVLVSTCNRCEIYFDGENIKGLENFLADFKGIDKDKAKKYYNVYTSENAVLHLLKVTCGMDSMVLGEDEILGQVKDAFSLALENRTTGFEFNTVFKMVITSVKKIKTNTMISKTPVSYGTLAANIVFSVPQEFKKVLIIGVTGKIGTITAKNILAKPNIKIMGTGRRHNAENQFVTTNKNVEIVPFAKRYEYINEADVIISATSSPHYTITKDEFLKYTSEKNRIFIDLAVPPDIDEEIADLKGCTLYGIDYFKTVSDKNSILKIKEAENIKQLLEEEKDEIIKELVFHDLVGNLSKLNKLVEEKGFEHMFYSLRKNTDRHQLEAVSKWMKSYIKSEEK